MRRHSRDHSQSSTVAGSLPLHQLPSTHDDGEWNMEVDDQRQPFLDETKQLNGRSARKAPLKSKRFTHRVLSLLGVPSISSQSPNQQQSRWQGLVVGAICALIVLLIQSLIAGLSSWASSKNSHFIIQPSSITDRSKHPVDGFRDFIKSSTPGLNPPLEEYQSDLRCNFSSLDLHAPFSPLCGDRRSMLDAMSGGGRLGWDAPYHARGCDFQWFTPEEVCSILSRFDNIYVIGDSMMRHLTHAIHVLLRGDLVDGGRATWMENSDPYCRCNRAFDAMGCVWNTAINSADLHAGAPESMRCPSGVKPGLVHWFTALSFPLTQQSLSRLDEVEKEPTGRNPFILGHGLWNDLQTSYSEAWAEQVIDAMREKLPRYFKHPTSSNPHNPTSLKENNTAIEGVDFSLFPRLFITPGAQGAGKPAIFHGVQNNIRMLRHAIQMTTYMTARGFEHLGAYNLTIQASSPDGTHTTYENNLVKAMMVMNWLNMLNPQERVATASGTGGKPLVTSERPLDEEEEADWTKEVAPQETQLLDPSIVSKHESVTATTTLNPTDAPAVPIAPQATPWRQDPHPIDELVETANQTLITLVKERTSGVAAAAAAYRSRRGRHPPPGFDKWVEYAESHGALMVESFFDQLHDDIEKFWAVPPGTIRNFPRSWPYILSLRTDSDGKREFRRWSDEPGNIAPWMQLWGDGFNRLPLADLPDVDLAFNGEDEPKLYVPWETLHALNVTVQEAKEANLPTSTANIVTEFSEREPFPTARPPVQDRNDYFFNRFPQEWPLWLAARNACHPDGAARAAPGAEDYTKPFAYPAPDTLQHMHRGYVHPSSWHAAKSACANPHIRNIHGSFIAMQSMSGENPLGDDYKAVITDMVPLLSGCKIQDVNTEILIPAAMQWPVDTMGGDNGFAFDEENRIPWEEKKNLVMWRGSASGGVNTADNWTRFQRHRLLAMLNGTLIAQHIKAMLAPETPKNWDGTPKLPAHVPGGRPLLPYNFPMPNTTAYPLATLASTSVSASIRRFSAWLDGITDAAFVHIRCFPPVTWFGPSAYCAYDSPFYTITPPVPSKEQYAYKYQPDVDGASYSGRYRALLMSNSLPLKATIYAEWHDSRLVPWHSFVPMDVGMGEIWGILEYFFGFESRDRLGGRVVVREGRDDMAKAIATQGSLWAQKVLRHEDMMIYVYRLILEIARLGDERREKMGFVADLV